MRISGYVSVIVPLHEGALTISRCLEAIAAQTYRPLEIVVVDDGSTDPGPAWVRAFRRAHPEVCVHVVTPGGAAPEGTGAALNAGLARARGEFVAFAHQADAWEPEKLARQVAQLQGDAAAGFSLAGVTEQVGEARVRVPAPAIGIDLLCEAVSLSSLVARVDAVTRAGGFDPQPGIAVTHDLVVRMLGKAKGLRLPDALATCHRPAGAALPVDALAATMCKLSAEGRLTRRQSCRRQGRLHARAGWRALVAEEPAAAAESFRQALRAAPWRPDAWLGLGFARMDQGLFRLGLLAPAGRPATARAESPTSKV